MSAALWTPAQAARADAAAEAAGVPLAMLMERAGYAVADAVAAITGYGAHIVALAGPGNNGGDAFVAAEVLRRRGFAIALIDCSSGAQKGAAAAARAAFRGETIPADDPRLSGATHIIDGLLGGGLSRPITGEMAELVARVARTRATIVAIDVPSGVDGATGAVRGPAITAARTVTFERRRPGHLLYPGRSHCGVVTLAPLHMPPAAHEAAAADTFANTPELFAPAIPRPSPGDHKYVNGHAAVVSAGPGKTGAARLAAMAALRGGAGLVTLMTPLDATAENAAHLTTVMLRPFADIDALHAHLFDPRIKAVCVGPGLPPTADTRDVVCAAFPMRGTAGDPPDQVMAAWLGGVVDAGGISAFAGDIKDFHAAVCFGHVVLTPHEGEFSRVFPGDGDKVTRVRAAAKAINQVVALKGADTVIADPAGRVAINENAPPWLATAGTGDILSGLITANLARGMPPFAAAAYGVFLHGAAAHRAGPCMIADDLMAALRETRAALEHPDVLGAT
ncbi:MAG: NAD(P)H-hydrate dehydratase [Pseudomonadota bacterium]